MLRDTEKLIKRLFKAPVAMDAKAAIGFSFAWFDGVMRKDGEPFFNHQARVAIEMARTGDANKVAASICHDVWEDPNAGGRMCSYAELSSVLTEEQFALVWWLTSPDKLDPRLAKAPRAFRKRMQRNHIRLGPSDAILIKLVDRVDNMRCLGDGIFDDDFLRTYVAETRLLCEEVFRDEVLTFKNEDYQVWEDNIRALAKLITDWEEKLGVKHAE